MHMHELSFTRTYTFVYAQIPDKTKHRIIEDNPRVEVFIDK